MSNRTTRHSIRERTAAPRQLLWLAALVVAAGGAGLAQQVSPALGTVEVTSGEPGQYVLDVHPDRIDAVAARYGLSIVRSIDGHGHRVYLVQGPAGSREWVDAVSSDPDVRHFELNAPAVAPEIPSGIVLDQSPLEILDAWSDRTLVPYFGQQAWAAYANQPAITSIRLPAAHGIVTGAGIVAIIDTGVDPTHPLLAGALVPGYDFVNDTAGQASEWSDVDPASAATLNQSPLEILDGVAVSLNRSTVAVLNSSTAQQLNPSALPPAFGHGTMVAGLVHLVAPTAKIMPLKAFRGDGSSRVFDIVRAIHYAVENGARVINMSFSTVELSPEIAHAINYATDNGVVCVSSVGNSGRELLVYPAALRNVLGVGSTTSTDPPARSAFSNYGDGLVRVGAPGQAVLTTYPGGNYAGAWGTSFSTAMVSGAAALLLQKDPDLDQQRASDFLGKAEKMPRTGMGRGRVNLFDSVRQLPDQTAPTVSFVTPSGAEVQGDVLVAVSASDNVGISSVRFLLDNQPLGADDTAAPYEVTWNTAAASNGSHQLTAVARDASGNQATVSTAVMVMNDGAAPTVSLTSPSDGATVDGAVLLTATAADDIGVVRVQFYVDGVAFGQPDVEAPYTLPWPTTSAGNGSHTVAAVAVDAAGRSTASTVAVTVANDSAAPSVTVTSPTASAIVTGTVTLTATAADDIGVVSVQFYVDGVALGEALVQGPYEIAWSTAAVTNGEYAVKAVARDAAGNVKTSAAVVVIVAN